MIRILKNVVHLFEAVIASSIYGFPGKKLKIIGVTGTDGKTTTTSLIYQVLKNAGKKVSMSSTVFAKIGDTVYDTGLHTTTPKSSFVQKMLKKSYEHGDEFFVLETTSHALDQNRVWGVPFEIAVLTNITHEHLDYHKTYAQYVSAKAKLLKNAKLAVINRDDASYELIKDILERNFVNYKTYGLKKEVAHYMIDLSKELKIHLPEFNKYNYLAAYVTLKKLGLRDAQIFEGMRSFVLPSGRIEEFDLHGVHAVVDFAHTPNAIHHILKYVTEKFPKSKIIHVFGSAGLRDKTKRPLMGQQSAKYADVTILTEEDYRTENVETICKEIAAGLEEKKKHFVSTDILTRSTTSGYSIITDRQQAITKASEIAKPGDVIVLTGKGHEQSLARMTEEVSWDDRVALKAVLNNSHL